MNDTYRTPSDQELSAMLDSWQVEMPDQQFFVNLPAAVQQAASRPARPWWSMILAPMPVTSFIMLMVLAFGMATVQSRLSADKRMSLTAASWASENYGWSNIDEALEAAAEETAPSQNSIHERYLSPLQKGTYLDGSDNAAQMLDDLSETEMEYLLSELQNSRS